MSLGTTIISHSVSSLHEKTGISSIPAFPTAESVKLVKWKHSAGGQDSRGAGTQWQEPQS